MSTSGPRSGPGTPPEDHFELSFRAEAYLSLFRRALLPGPNGAVVATDTVLPVQQYVDFQARGLDLPFATDGLDIESP